MRYRSPETAPRRRAFLIIQPIFSDIGQRWWDLTRVGGPKGESIGGIQPVGSSKPNRFPPGVPFKPLFQGQTYLATYAKTGLILLTLELSGWIASGELKHGEDIQEGIENTPKTFLRLFEGKNVGKQLLKIAEPPL